ncbi:hypothetical protein [Psychromonas sp. MME2]|uniref:hypothetical protein n=1 Tax=unclassified Psychromonas TaxID=2614957 RepID=UPI00339CE6C8
MKKSRVVPLLSVCLLLNGCILNENKDTTSPVVDLPPVVELPPVEGPALFEDTFTDAMNWTTEWGTAAGTQAFDDGTMKVDINWLDTGSSNHVILVNTDSSIDATAGVDFTFDIKVTAAQVGKLSVKTAFATGGADSMGLFNESHPTKTDGTWETFTITNITPESIQAYYAQANFDGTNINQVKLEFTATDGAGLEDAIIYIDNVKITAHKEDTGATPPPPPAAPSALFEDTFTDAVNWTTEWGTAAGTQAFDDGTMKVDINWLDTGSSNHVILVDTDSSIDATAGVDLSFDIKVSAAQVGQLSVKTAFATGGADSMGLFNESQPTKTDGTWETFTIQNITPESIQAYYAQANFDGTDINQVKLEFTAADGAGLEDAIIYIDNVKVTASVTE